jgi:ubiquinone/menaquinone biosynthesis C-methylase UbiE
MLRVARLTPQLTGRRAKVRYVLGTAESLPLPERSGSVVWSLATVHHWRDIGVGLAEVRRVLRPDGRFLAIEREIGPGATGLASHGWTGQQAHTFAELCRQAGFADVSVDRHRTDRRTVLTVLAVR